METQNKNMIFSKFFPADNAFVNVSGDFKNKDDWQLRVAKYPFGLNLLVSPQRFIQTLKNAEQRQKSRLKMT